MQTNTCRTCGEKKSIKDFSVGYVRKDGAVNHRTQCKSCVRKNSKVHYYANSEPTRRYDGSFDMSFYGKQRLLAFRAWMDSLKNMPCSDCGKKFPSVCMDFDHVQGKKKKDVSSMWSRERSKVIEELAKCDLVCANCHRIRTHERRTRLQETA